MPGSRRSRILRPLACLVATIGFSPATRGDTYAFLVGVSNYESKDELKPLRYSCDDMIAFAGVLRNGGVDGRNIVILHDAQANPRFQPVARKIKNEFHLLLATLEPEDTLIVGFAGHGIRTGPEGDDYFLPADAVLNDPATMINLRTIYEEMRQSRAGRKLLLVDACRNDPEADLARSVGVKIQPPQDMADRPLPEGIAALFSCSGTQRSYEDPKLRHGIFFYQVIEAWKGAADVDHDRKVTLEELEAFVRRETKIHARDALSMIQMPVFRIDRRSAAGWVVSSPGGPSNGDRADTSDLLDRGDSMLRKGSIDEAEREFNKALQVDPDSTRAHRGLAMIHGARGQFAQALRAYSEVIRIDPSDASAYVGRAITHGASGDLNAALADYEQAIRINPNLALAHVGKGAILARLNRTDEAIAACSRAIAIDNRNAMAYYNRGVAREAKKDAGAAQDFLKASQLDPSLKAR